MVAHVAMMKDKGRVVVPTPIRRRRGWAAGTALVFAEDESGVRVMSAEEALAVFRRSVAGAGSPVDELLAERRREAARDTLLSFSRGQLGHIRWGEYRLGTGQRSQTRNGADQHVRIRNDHGWSGRAALLTQSLGNWSRQVGLPPLGRYH
ncbi:MAG: AbrB/MazE/SpoVT family DNA-binding domain-containing protein [Bifidobacteriaceae bacterium]|jgi:AbrB family looped-hinge helix DNA binding protein|nr:AbrB/MazE/SpoVT family DNA-binding domain-containing protein [Bifidobacteriaceae bacterium]